MPLFNRYTLIPQFLGEGSGDGSIVSINAKPFFGPSAGSGGWFNEFNFIAQYYNEHQHPIIILVDIRTGKYTLLLDDGAPFIMAGGGLWSAMTMNNGTIVNGQRTTEDISPIIYGPEGTLAYTDHSHVGLWTLKNNVTKKITDEEVWDVTVLDADQLVYSTIHGVELHLNGVKVPCVTLGGLNEFGHLRAYWWLNNLWLAYQWYNANSIVTHPYDSYTGYTLGTGDCYGLDAYVYDKPYYAWSVSPAAQAEHMVFINKLGEKFDLRTLIQPPVPDDDMQEQIDALNARVSALESTSKQQQNQINSLNSQVSQLNSRVTKLESSKPSGDSKIVAIKSVRGKYLRDDWDDNLAHFDRDVASEGEFYTLEPQSSNNPGPEPIPPDNHPISDSMRTDGKFFKRNDGIVRIKRFSSFKLLNLFEKGNDVEPILNQFAGYNSARIFAYTPKKDWGDEAWDFPDKLATHEFMLMMGEAGFDVSLCLITDNDRAMIDKAKELISYLSVNPVNNLMLEAVNEPEEHEKIDPSELKNALTNSPYLFSSGIYKDNKKFYGKVWLRHSPRDNEWWRKGGHELMEAWDGGGPNFPDEPSLKMPGIQDEPIKSNETGYDVKGFYEYAASCALMGAGATFHCENGKFSKLLTKPESDCMEAFLIGLNKYPLDAANGAYRRIDESETGRTYVVGNYAIRIHQQGYDFPETGWYPMDDIGVCWRK